jgi:hypothetical protein
VTWAGALLIWRYGRIEEKWSGRLAIRDTVAQSARSVQLRSD